MKDFNQMNEAELTAVLNVTEAIARRARFAQNGSLGDLSEPDAADLAEAKKQAADYARAVNSGARSRQYDQHDDNAREGVRSALDWLARKRKSAIKK